MARYDGPRAPRDHLQGETCDARPSWQSVVVIYAVNRITPRSIQTFIPTMPKLANAAGTAGS